MPVGEADGREMNGWPKQLAVVSGKGGTGKTTVLASFAALAQRSVLADCDVDAPNLHLLLHPEVREREEFWGAKVAVREVTKCQKAGECERRCRFGTITTETVDVLGCEGCGLCVLACPNDALRLETIVCGEYYISDTRYGPMAHAKLRPAAESSGRLVTMVRQKGEEAALKGGYGLILIDGPPGIGCTAIASLAEVDLALIVTEPTLSGIHDMERVMQLTAHFGIPTTVLINKADINQENAEKIRVHCADRGVEIIGELPFDAAAMRALAAGRPLVEVNEGEVARGIRRAWKELEEIIETL